MKLGVLIITCTSYEKCHAEQQKHAQNRGALLLKKINILRTLYGVLCSLVYSLSVFISCKSISIFVWCIIPSTYCHIIDTMPIFINKRNTKALNDKISPYKRPTGQRPMDQRLTGQTTYVQKID